MKRLALLVLGVWAAHAENMRVAGAAEELTIARALGARTAGLVVHVGTADAALVLECAGRGSFLSQALVSPDRVAAVRQQVASAGRLGQVSVRAFGGGALPYGPTMVNVLIVDGDALGAAAPTREEMMRVLVPRGVLWIKRDGAWSSTEKPWDDKLGEWTHFLANPAGTAASDDRRVAPGNSLRWQASDHTLDIRLAGGMAIILNGTNRWNSKGRDPVDDGLVGRDAFNGVAAWAHRSGMLRARWGPEAFVADARRVVWFPGVTSGPAVALDTRGGAELMKYSDGVTHDPNAASKSPFAYVIQVLVGNTLLQAKDSDLVALDAASGKVKWSWKSAAAIRRLVADHKRCFVLEAAPGAEIGARWRSAHDAKSIACIQDGKLLWRNDKLPSTRANDLALLGNDLFCYTSGTNMDPGEIPEKPTETSKRPIPHVMRYAADTGKEIWHTSTGPIGMGGGNPWLNNMVVRDDGVWGSPSAQHFDLATGQARRTSPINLNFRCVRMAGTSDWLLYGFSVWLHRDGTAYNAPVARGDCAMPAYLAMGASYIPNNITCNCLVQLHGTVVVQADAPPVILPEADRLDKAPSAGNEWAADVAPPAPIALDWQPHYLATWLIDRAPRTTAGGMALEVETDRNRLTARRGDAVAWRYVADGRIYAGPLMSGDRCFVPCADGNVTCVDLATGKPRWRFLGALNHSQVVNDGQLESRWPVYDAVMHKGALVIAAGRQDCLDGGILVWGLDPASGAVKWRTRFHTPLQMLQPGQKAIAANDKGIVNGGLEVKDDQLILRSPLLNKGGSSPTTVGYYLWPKGQEFKGPAPLRHRPTTIDPVSMDGKTITIGNLTGRPAGPAR